MNLLAMMPDDLSVRAWSSAGGEPALCLAFHNFEKPDDTVSTAEKNALTFEVLSDIG
jgi:hypothetical protein